MNRNSLKLAFLAATYVALSFIQDSRVLGQTAPGVLADRNSPSGAPDPTKLDDVWQVDPITGDLTVTISFPTVPSSTRGPQIPFKLMYNSASTITLQMLGSSVLIPGLYYPDPPQETGTVFEWSPTPLGRLYGPAGPWTTSGPFSYTSGDVVPSQQISTSITWAGCAIYGPYIYSDENGTAHDLNQLYKDTFTGSPSLPACDLAQTTTGTVPAQDGSGIESNLSGVQEGTVPTVIYPNGTHAYTSGLLEDSNGNEVSRASDSRGLAPFTTTIPIGQVGQIPVGSYTVSTSDESGRSKTSYVEFTPVAIGSFTMPHPTSSEIKVLPGCESPCGDVFTIDQPTSGATLSAVTQISLPNSTAYSFEYDPTYGTMSKISFPTGGYVRFVWGIRGDSGGFGQELLSSSVVVTDVYESTGSGPEMHWNYSLPSYSTSTGLTSTVTAPDGSYTNYVGTPIYFTTVRQFLQVASPTWKVATSATYNSSGVLLKSTSTEYASGAANGLPLNVATTYYTPSGGNQQQVQYTHDNYANVVEKDESQFYACTGSPCSVPSSPPGGWARKTLTSYLWSAPNSTQPTYNYTSAGIVDRPSQVLITDGSGNPYSEVQYNYDESALSGSTGIVNHDDTNYPSSMKGPRGNLTSEKDCLTFSGSVLNLR